MAEVKEKVRAETAAVPSVRPAGTAVGSGAGVSPPEDKVVLSAKDFALIGSAIGSRIHWQADFARSVGYSRSNITRYLKGTRPTNNLLARGLRRVILQQIETLAKLLNTVGLPFYDDQTTLDSQQDILHAVKIMRARDKDEAS